MYYRKEIAMDHVAEPCHTHSIKEMHKDLCSL